MFHDHGQQINIFGARSGAVVEATNQKVPGSIADGVTEIFRWHNHYGRTMALGLTQPLS
jgi:hypothetical protein